MSAPLRAGFVLRIDPTANDPQWTAERRETFLLRADIRRPLSVDPWVWTAASAVEALPWEGIDAVRPHAVARSRSDRCRVAIVALGFVVADAADEEVARERGFESELDIEASWWFLGFDIADGTTSGLSNCGYNAASVDAYRATWAPRVNEHGLLANERDAVELRAITNQRVPEHAPFGVFGLWVVETVG